MQQQTARLERQSPSEPNLSLEETRHLLLELGIGNDIIVAYFEELGERQIEMQREIQVSFHTEQQIIEIEDTAEKRQRVLGIINLNTEGNLRLLR